MKTLILFWGMLKGSKATMAELVGKGMRIHEERKRWSRWEEGHGDWDLYNARPWGWCSSHYLPENDQKPGHICHICPPPPTDTDRGREREADIGEEDGKDVDMPGLSKDVNRTEHKRWAHRYTVEDKIYFKDKRSRWTDAEQRDKATKKAMRGGITRMKEKTTKQIKAVERENVTALVLVFVGVVSYWIIVFCFIVSLVQVFVLLCPCAVFLSWFSVTVFPEFHVQLLLSLCFMCPRLSF